MRFAAHTYPIGIDLDDRCFTAAQFRMTRHGIRLRGLLCRPLAPSAPGEDAELLAALKSVRSCGFFKGRRVAVNLPFQDLSVFPVQFLLDERDDPEEAILREASKVIPYPLEEAVIDYPSLLKQSGACAATVVAVRRQVMLRWLEILRSAGLTAEVMEFGVSSLIRLHRSLFPEDGQSDLICHIGRTHSLLAVATGEGLLCLAEISWGIQSLWDRIGAHLELPQADREATNLLKTYGLVHMEQETAPQVIPDANDLETRKMSRVMYQIVAPAVDEFVFEVHKSISYLRSLNNCPVFEKIYLYGLAGLILNLDRYLEKSTGTPVQRVDALANMDYACSDMTSCLPEGISPVPALGLAMREIPWL